LKAHLISPMLTVLWSMETASVIVMVDESDRLHVDVLSSTTWTRRCVAKAKMAHENNEIGVLSALSRREYLRISELIRPPTA